MPSIAPTQGGASAYGLDYLAPTSPAVLGKHPRTAPVRPDEMCRGFATFPERVEEPGHAWLSQPLVPVALQPPSCHLSQPREPHPSQSSSSNHNKSRPSHATLSPSFAARARRIGVSEPATAHAREAW